ncbi:MAG: hypothetical protein AAGB16_09600 [Pseudomonadota bacterium]
MAQPSASSFVLLLEKITRMESYPMAERIVFKEPEMQPVFDRFTQVFDPNSKSVDDFPTDVKIVVWARMFYAFHPSVSRKEIRSHFYKTFHPDTGTQQLTNAEKNQVAATGESIFKV